LVSNKRNTDRRVIATTVHDLVGQNFCYLTLCLHAIKKDFFSVR